MSDQNAPAAATADDDDSDRIAKHEILDSTGAVVEDGDFDAAHGIRYTDRDSGIAFDWLYGKASEAAKRSLACFGAKTLATNTTSGVRQKHKKQGGASGAVQIDGLKARFDLVESGEWVDRTRGPVSWDVDKLAQATINVSVADGKLQDQAAQAAALAKMIEKMNDPVTGKDVQTRMRNVKGVVAEYQALTGKASGTVDDITAMLAG